MTLSTLDSISLATVLEDCSDQLNILGYMFPVSVPDTKQEEYLTLEERFLLEEQKPQLREWTVNKNNSVETTVVEENLKKVQKDRAFLEEVLSQTVKSLLASGSYSSLVQALQREATKKLEQQQLLEREEVSRQELQMLKKKLLEIKRQKETDLQQLDETVAYKKDQLQEMKVQTGMELRYVDKWQQTHMNLGLQQLEEVQLELQHQIDNLRDKVDEEIRANAEIDSFLRNSQAELEQKVEFWMEKYEQDIEAKERELAVLRSARANTYQRLQDLSKQFQEYHDVVEEDQAQKEKIRLEKEREALENASAIKIQAWWRGTMVRRGLGPYKKRKGKKGGKKGGKKKGK